MSLSETFKTCLAIESDETVLLLTDSDMANVSKFIEAAVKPLTDELLFLSITPRRLHGEELPPAVTEAMATSDVVIGATSKSMTHTKATRNAVIHGTRVASMPGITSNMLTNGGMTADYKEVSTSAKKVGEILSVGKNIHIKTAAGTDFTADISGREGYADTGLLTKKGEYGNLPGGEGFIAPIEGGSNGRIVFDGPIASSGLSHTPITVDVQNGMVVYTDYKELIRLFREIKNATMVGEIGIGVNPIASLIGNILEDEKVLGTTHIAFGNNKNCGGEVDANIHLDGIIKTPTIEVDGDMILQDGDLLL